MSDELLFLRKIADHPDDNLPRLIFADWLEEQGDPRAELIRVQCRLQGMEEDDSEYASLKRRERAIVPDCARRWWESLDVGGEIREPLQQSASWDRGLPAGMAATAEVLLREGPALVGQLPTLGRLELQGWSDDSVEALVGSPVLDRLRALVLSGRTVREQSLRTLFQSPRLTVLEDLALQLNLPSPAVEVLGPLAGQLRRLNLFGNRVNQLGIRVLADSGILAGLTHLNLGCNRIGDEGLRALAELAQAISLEELNLSTGWFGGLSVAALMASPGMRNLKRLDLSHNWIGADGVGAIREAPQLTQLEALELNGCRIQMAGCRRLLDSEQLQSVKRLGLADNQFNAQALWLLTESPYLEKLEQLDLGNNEITGAALRWLINCQSLPRLRRLTLSGNPLRPEGVDQLIRLPLASQLHRLDLSHCQLNTAGFSRLVGGGQLPRLRELGVAGNNLGDAGLAALRTARGLEQLESLRLGATGGSPDGLSILLEDLPLPALWKITVDFEAYYSDLRSRLSEKYTVELDEDNPPF